MKREEFEKEQLEQEDPFEKEGDVAFQIENQESKLHRSPKFEGEKEESKKALSKKGSGEIDNDGINKKVRDAM